MINPELLQLLVCPEKKCPVRLADDSLIEKINQRINAGTLQNRGGAMETEPVDGGLIREGDDFLYPIRDDIPVMLIDEAISLEGLI